MAVCYEVLLLPQVALDGHILQCEQRISKFFIEKRILHSFKLKSFRDSRGRHYINTCMIFFYIGLDQD